MIKNSRPLARPTPLGIAACAALAVAAAGCRRGPPPPEGYQGIVEYDQRALAFEVAGRVDKVLAKRGDLIKDGETVAQLDDTLARLTRDTRRDDVKTAQADLALVLAGSRSEDVASTAAQVQGAMSAEDLARKSNERTKALVASGAISSAELDRTSAELDRAISERKSLEQRLALLRHGARPEELARARARVDEANSALALEEERVARYALRSKGPGEVLDVTVEPGELAAVGTVGALVADTSHPYVDVFVPQGEMDRVRVGAKSSVRVDATSAPFGGTVEYVSPQTEFTPKFMFSERERPNLVVRVRVRVDDPERRLHAGVPAFAQVIR